MLSALLLFTTISAHMFTEKLFHKSKTQNNYTNERANEQCQNCSQHIYNLTQTGFVWI